MKKIMKMVTCAIISLSLLSIQVRAEAPTIYRSQYIKVYAFERVLMTWGDDQWIYFNDLVKRESNWNSEAKNPASSAYGFGQLLDSTWKSVGCEKTSDPYIQIDCTIKYVKDRYGTPKQAIIFHNKANWY